MPNAAVTSPGGRFTARRALHSRAVSSATINTVKQLVPEERTIAWP
jgi:hypothetical protein